MTQDVQAMAAAANAANVLANQAVETIFRMERVRLIAGLARHVGDLGLAEDLAQDALVAALANWPVGGVPPNPGGWLMIAAKRRAIDLWRRRRMMGREEAALVHGIESQQPDPVAAIEAKLDDDIGDERLSLMFAACHPLLSRDQRTALTLKVIRAWHRRHRRAFLTQETTIAQRSSAPRKSCGMRVFRSKCRAEQTGMSVWPRSSKRSISSSTRAT